MTANMRIRNKEIRARRHRKAKKIKAAIKELKGKSKPRVTAKSPTTAEETKVAATMTTAKTTKKSATRTKKTTDASAEPKPKRTPRKKSELTPPETSAESS
jgi:hypothetical protein